MNCQLCLTNNKNTILYQNELFYIVDPGDAYYPGYLRLVMQQHVKELTDLPFITAQEIFRAVFKLEQVIRDIYQPDKINIASLGNMVMHLHWHIIPRYTLDRHYPNPIWGAITHPEYQPVVNVSRQQQLLSAIVSALSS